MRCAYFAKGTDASNLLFHVLNVRHLKRRSMVFTTKTLNSWGNLLHNPDLGETIVDRIIERFTVLKLDGASVRSRHVKPSELKGAGQVPSEPAIVSGMDRPSFPETTVRRCRPFCGVARAAVSPSVNVRSRFNTSSTPAWWASEPILPGGGQPGPEGGGYCS